jgi:hypothetical protein
MSFQVAVEIMRVREVAISRVGVIARVVSEITESKKRQPLYVSLGWLCSLSCSCLYISYITCFR